MQQKKKALGRGLSALLETPETEITPRDVTGDFVTGAIAQVVIDNIEPNPFQPRVHFSEEELADLAISIQQQGIIQPITVRKLGHERYQLISGERRLKASKVAGMKEIPAYIRIANDEQMLEMALVENIQRQDLNPIEIAHSFQRLLEECNIRQEDLSQKVGKDRSTISNYIRLLKLPAEIQAAIRDQKISMGHARSLITVNDPATQTIILHMILDRQLSVRQVEDLVRTGLPAKTTTKIPARPVVSEKYESVKTELRQKFQVPVDVRVKPNGSGQITLKFRSEEELEKILSSFEK